MSKKNFLSVLEHLFLVFLIGLLNFWLIRPVFEGHFSQFMESIEISYITMSKFFSMFRADFSWNPYWYAGFPLFLIYTPLLPFLMSVVKVFSPMLLVPQIYRLVSGTAYCLVPIALYFLAYTLFHRKSSSFISAIAFSVLPSWGYLIKEVAGVASHFDLAPWRFIIWILYGEGPHTFSQVFYLLAAASYYQLLKTKKLIWLLFSALMIALTGLTNAVGFIALVFILLIISVEEMVFPHKRKDPASTKTDDRFFLGLVTALLSYGLLAFWYNPLFVGTFLGEGGGTISNYLNLFPWGLILILFITISVLYVVSFLKKSSLRIIILGLLFFLIIVFSHYQWQIDYLPQALRYIIEGDVFLALFLGFCFNWLTNPRTKSSVLNIFILSVSGFVFLFIFCLTSRRFLDWKFPLSFSPSSQIFSVADDEQIDVSGEKQIATFLSERLSDQERVFVAGNYAFWLNYFEDVRQIRGGIDQASCHPWVLHATYQICQGESGEISVWWNKIFNVRYVVVNLINSRNPFKDFAYPEKFYNLLPVVSEQKGDVIFEVPLKNPGLAQTVEVADMETLSVPKSAIDEDPLREYVLWLESGHNLDFKQESNGHYLIYGDVSAGEGILVQMSYFPGWKAVVNGQKIRVEADPLGFIFLPVNSEGFVSISLDYHLPFWFHLGVFISMASLSLFLFLFFRIIFSGIKRL